MSEKNRLGGLVFLNSLKNQIVGMNKSILTAEPWMAKYGVDFYYFVPRSIFRFIESILKFIFVYRKFSFDFVLFNGAASLFHGNSLNILVGHLLINKGIPIFIYWHESDMAFERMRKLSPKKLNRIYDFVLQNSHIIHLCASKFTEESLRRRYGPILTDIVYENSFVPKPFDAIREPSQPPLIVNLATIQKRKGTDLFVETAIKVCETHPSVKFIWMGEGNPFGTWKNEIKKAGLEKRILFPGHIESAYMILRESSILFMSSRDDPMPLSVIEAMSLGKTIVTFDSGGTPEVLGGHCILIPNFDTDLAAKAILSYLKKKPSELINENVRKIYLREFTPSRFSERLSNIIRERMNSNPQK
jgi:glycosyltransferase involved in cell wall biosynthesis